MAKQGSKPVDPYEVYGLWRRGVTPETVASIYDLPLAKVRAIIEAEKEKQPKLADQDPEEIIRDHQIRISAIVEELANLAAREKGPARVRAVEGRFAAEKHLFGVHHSVGLLPRDLGEVGIQIDIDRMADQLRRVLTENEVPKEVLAEIAETLKTPGRRNSE